jgi:membrane-bound lytic murein transglycosylase D
MKVDTILRMHLSRLFAAIALAALVVLTGWDAQQSQASPVTGSAELPAPLQSQAKPAQPTTASSASSGQSATEHRNQQLIDAVEQAYQAGLTNYQAGHLEAAKANFDYSVDQLLLSGLDLKNDPQLSAEFERVVDAINTLEMEALKQGNGFAPRTESTPVDVANDVTYAVDPALKALAQADLKTTQSDLPLVLNDYVASYINYFTNTRIGHNTLVNSLTRASKYKQMIQRVLAEEGVPQDLIYQAVAESGFQPQIRNARSGAGGMWQFMPGDAYAPPRSAWYDQRFDPEKSTRAYARYIKYLYNQMGDWYLAMASYDWGAGNVQRAVQRTGYADFWELYRRNALPQETKNYVPIILAATIMAKNPKQYGLDGIITDAPLITDTVATNYSVDLRLVADIVEAPVQEIVALNPSLLRMATPPDDSFDLHLPPGTKDLYNKRIAEIPVDRRKSWRFHKVAAGETLEEIARSYHVSATEIAFVNQLGNGADNSAAGSISGIESLIIPVAAVSSSSTVRSTRYVARKGDTLVTVADRFNVSVEQLRSWNHLRGTSIVPGHSLYVSEPARISTPRGHRRATPGSGGTSVHHGASHATPVATHKTAAPTHSATPATKPAKHQSPVS